MKESTGVFLGFGAVAVGVILVPIAFSLFGMKAMDRPPANVDGPISRAFLGVEADANGPAKPVPAVDTVLPVGMPQDAALRDLHKEGFDCSPQDHGAVCRRTLPHASASEDWTVTLSFDEAGHLASRSGASRVKSL